MMNRYYLVTLQRRGDVGRLSLLQLDLPPAAGRRERPHQLVHWRLSLDESQALVEAAVTEEELQRVLEQGSWVQYLGAKDTALGYSPAVFAFLTDQAGAWNVPA